MVDETLVETIPLKHWDDGSIRVGRSRVTLDSLIADFDMGSTPEQIIQDYVTLRLDDVYLILGYYLRHKAEVDQYLEERRRQAEAIRRENEQRFPTRELRERLMARMRDRESSAAPRGG